MRGKQTLWLPSIPQQHIDTAARWTAGGEPIFIAIAGGPGPGADIPTSEIHASYRLPFAHSPLTPRECHFALWRHAANVVAREAARAQRSANVRMRDEAGPLRDLGLWIGNVLDTMWLDYRIGLPDPEAAAAWKEEYRMFASRQEGGLAAWRISWKASTFMQSTCSISDPEADLLLSACSASSPALLDEGVLLSLIQARRILSGHGLAFRATAFARAVSACVGESRGSAPREAG